MRLVIDIPDYDGNSLDVIWEEGSEYAITVHNNDIMISANKSGLVSLAKQMLYMAHNNLPAGSHIHYDSFFTKGSNGCTELIVEKKED